ncbi:hypothetical protein LWI28_016991 [Acer negundo]|uniref:40S ribosomal protein S7 n=1 Tax=Acer negundo TaxID=4023 RepID=A0AAD5P5W8_ACENE|nr:hypothetical protein LWI28_016991 [Acer negundo]
MMVMTYNPNDECHRVYKNAKANVTWIASKFELLVKCNHNIKIEVIADLLRDRFKLNVDVQSLYKAKGRALDGLGREHDECFVLLMRYAYMVNVCNTGYAKMYRSKKKIQKDHDVEPTEFEETVAQALFDLRNTNQELKSDLKDLYINQAMYDSMA